MSYAVKTDVSVEKSRAEIEKILLKAGANRFMYASDEAQAAIAFQFQSKQIRFLLPLPDRNDSKFKKSPSGRVFYDTAEQYRQWEQACRSKWRALCLCIKAKIEAVECGITTFEQEFLAHFVMPNGRVFGDIAIPQIEQASKDGKMPVLALTFGEKT